MTRGEALLAMDSGTDIEGLLYGKWYKFWVDLSDDGIVSNQPEAMTNNDAFLTCADYRISYARDSKDQAVKIIIDWLAWEVSGEAVEDYESLLTRARALLAQMDGEK